MISTILVLNSGSSSIKFRLYASEARQALKLLYRGQVEGIGTRPHFAVQTAAGQEVENRDFASEATQTLTHERLLTVLLTWVEKHSGELTLVGAGHRVVHGGTVFTSPQRVDEQLLARLDRLVPLAPLHQPHNLAAIRALAQVRPDLPQVVCFDTAFHRTLPAVAQAFALPRELSDAGIRRYGFHGISYEYIASVLPDYAGPAADGRVVVAHLGAGASMCAMLHRRSVATTMGFTALDGLAMATRCGSLDPGVLLYLLSERGLDEAALTDLLYHRSGLLGVSGISGDMRQLLASDAAPAAEAIELFVYRIGRELGSLAAALGGLDALVFTAGIGEHAPAIRQKACAQARWLGIHFDEEANRRGGPRISAPDSPVSVWVVPTDEELMIARHTVELLNMAR
jgi:acetate kinase